MPLSEAVLFQEDMNMVELFRSVRRPLICSLSSLVAQIQFLPPVPGKSHLFLGGGMFLAAAGSGLDIASRPSGIPGPGPQDTASKSKLMISGVTSDHPGAITPGYPPWHASHWPFVKAHRAEAPLIVYAERNEFRSPHFPDRSPTPTEHCLKTANALGIRP